MHYKLLIVILILNVCSHAFAKKCVNNNLYTKKNSPLTKMPVHDQDGSGMCYAYTAAQLVNYELIKKGKANTPKVHPVWMALLKAVFNDEKKLSSGVVSKTLGHLNALSLSCDYEVVHKALQKFGKETGKTDPEVVDFFEDLAKNYEKQKNINYSVVASTVVSDSTKGKFNFEQWMSEAQNAKDKAKKTVIDNMNLSCDPEFKNDVKKMLENAPIEDATKIVLKMVFEECWKRPKKVVVPKPKNLILQNPPEQFADLARTFFSVSNRPLAISYCSKALKKPAYKGLKVEDNWFFDDEWEFKNKDECGYHASILVGSRPKGNSCQYLLRNSWGTHHGNWTKSWDCFCQNKKTGEYVDNCKKATHPSSKYRVLGCWVDESSLSHNTGSITWI
jgi:hypothetical protein